MTNPITILIAALGGEGGGVMADWLMEAATASGLPAQATSIPGVAQRTGATTYYLEIFPLNKRSLNGKDPVLSRKVASLKMRNGATCRWAANSRRTTRSASNSS